MQDFLARQCGAGTNSHDSIETENHVVASKPEPIPSVRDRLRGNFTQEAEDDSDYFGGEWALRLAGVVDLPKENQ